MRGLTLNQKEQARLQVLNGVLGGKVGMAEAARTMGVSERQAWRIVAAYRREGSAALVHGNRGRRPANAIPAATRDQLLGLVRTRYLGVNHTHLAELLAEREGLVLGRSTVRRILVGAGLASPRRRRPPRHRVRRERMPQEGMLVQIDGSIHDWLEGRGPRLSLLLAVDDATGSSPGAVFREQEDSHGYFLLLRGIIERQGIPLALYGDRHTALWHPGSARAALNGSGPEQLTQFGRALRELGIQQIFAYSPQAKGRVERLAGTFQDRLVSELRLARVHTLAGANAFIQDFLPRFNRRFSVPAAEASSAYRPLARELDLTAILCPRYGRTVGRDNTVKYKWRTLQLLPGRERPSYAGTRVEVQERLDGSLVVCSQGKVIPTREAPPRANALRGANSAGVEVHSVRPSLRFLERLNAYPVEARARERWESGGFVNQGAPATRSARIPGRETSSPRPGGFPQLPDSPPRRPTPRQQARWDAVQIAKRHGLSVRAIARQLGLARGTVRKYAAASSPPVNPRRRTSPSTNGREELTESLVT